MMKISAILCLSLYERRFFMAANGIIELSDSNFDAEVIKSDVPVLVDFWAPWCGPCRAIAPAVEEISSSYQGKLKVGKLNVDESPQTTMKFGIRSIPTLIVFKGGMAVEQIIGAVPKGEIERAVGKAL
jgi:thioredoxin 1